jgi:hypothetical protein
MISSHQGGDVMSECFKQTIEQVKNILEIIQDCVRRDKYIVSNNENRRENVEFFHRYNLTSARQKEIILKIKPEDFCHLKQNRNIGYEYENLYVFCPQVNLYNFDGEVGLVDIYLKFNIVNCADSKRVIIISFHKRNYSVEYLFR